MPAVFKASGVLAWLSHRVGEVGAGDLSSGFALHESAYRFSLEGQPEATMDGCYYVDGKQLRMDQTTYGQQRRRWTVDATVEIGFHNAVAPSDDRDESSSRLAVNKRALDDCQVVLDALEDPLGYRPGETGIQTVRSAGAAVRVAQADSREIWAIPVTITYETAWIVTPTQAGA